MDKVILLARLSAQEAFDLHRFTSALRAAGQTCYTPSLERDVLRFLRIENLTALSATTWKHLSSLDQRPGIVILSLFVTNFGVYRGIGNALKSIYGDKLTLAPVIDNPLQFFNDYTFRPLNERQRQRNRELFVENSLYRVDEFLHISEQIGKDNLKILASGSTLDNEMALFSHIMPADYPVVNLPTPISHAAKDVNRFFGLPRCWELFTIEQWRQITDRFNADLTRSGSSDDFNRVSNLAGRYWRYATRRYPELEQVADFDPAPYIQRPEYAGYDAKKLAALLPENFSRHFGCLRNGFSEFFQPVFNEFERIDTPQSLPRCAVVTFTYNHEKYIADCIEGVARQKDCDVEHLIFDDASSDDTPQIIAQFALKYPHIKPVLFRQKPGSTIGPAFQSVRHEYLALCDGDDYFTDPYKLSKQIAFLDSHRDHAMCAHFAKVTYEDGRESHLFPGIEAIDDRRSFDLADILQGNFIQTCSVMYRWRFREGLPWWFNPRLRPGDWYWHVLHAETGLIGFIPEAMAVYRRHAKAVYATADANDVEKHFLCHGLRELEVFQELDWHFKGKHHKDFEVLATGIFAMLFINTAESGNNGLYMQAARLFPEFEREFRSHLSQSDPGAGDNSPRCSLKEGNS